MAPGIRVQFPCLTLGDDAIGRMTEKNWTREHPAPPTQEPSDYYWFKYDGDEYEVVVDVWVDRKYWPKGWWGPEVLLAERAPKDVHKTRKR